MSQTWYVKHNGKTVGPITSAQLKVLVGRRQIKSESEICLGDDGKWTTASKVKGLLPATSPQRQQPSTPQAKSPARQTDHAKITSRTKNTGPVKSVPQVAANPYQSPAFPGEGRPVSSAVDTRGMETTRAGLYTVYYGICAVLFAMGVGSLFAILGASMDIAVFLMLAGVLAIVAGLGGYIAILVGQILCLTVPRESGGKWHVQIAVAVQALSILLAIGGVEMAAMLEASGSKSALFESVLSFVLNAMVLVGYICFLNFIKNLALYIGRNDLASSSSTVMKMVIVVAVMLFVFSFMVDFIAGGVGLLVFSVLMLIMVITFLITFIRYANLVGYLARAIPK